MSSPSGRILGELEQAVMGALWKQAPACVRDVAQALAERGLAYTTLMTTLDRLHKKGLLDRTKQGQAFFYRPTMDQETYERRLVAAVLESLPTSSRASVLSGFLDFAAVDDDALSALEQLIATRKRDNA
jgi:predicted transcriptional regulator